MMKYEQDLIYVKIPRLTEAIEKLTEQLLRLNELKKQEEKDKEKSE